VADRFPKSARYEGIDADLWPKFLFSLAVIFSLLLIVQFFIRYKIIINNKINKEKEVINYGKMGLCIALIIGYFIVQSYLGFILTTTLFVFLGMLVAGYENKRILVLYPLGFTVFVTLVFVKLLALPLPRGVSYFEDFSYLLY